MKYFDLIVIYKTDIIKCEISTRCQKQLGVLMIK